MRYYMLVAIAIAYLSYVNSDACVQCNSSNDIKCATNPEAFLAKECANSTSKCYTRVLKGETIRGCANDLDNATAIRCNNEMECLICSFMEGCNRQIFPMHRAQCLQCAGNWTSDCATNVFSKPTVCPSYVLGESCYIRKTEDRKKTKAAFERGCLSEAQSKKLCIDRTNCYVCEGAGCNFLYFNSEQIPIAHDSASLLSYPSILLALGYFLVTRFN